MTLPPGPDRNGNADEVAFLRSLRDQAERRIGPLINEIDRAQEFSVALWDALRDMEIFGLPFDPAVGGSGASFATYIRATEELARVGGIAGLFTGTTVQ